MGTMQWGSPYHTITIDILPLLSKA